MNRPIQLHPFQQSVLEGTRRFTFRSGGDGGKTRDMVCAIIAHAIATPKAVVGTRYTPEEMKALCERMGFACTLKDGVLEGVLNVSNSKQQFPWSFTVSTFKTT
jgi:hypothetical protein